MRRQVQASGTRPPWDPAPDRCCDPSSLVTPGREVDRLELELLDVARGVHRVAGPLPRRDVREVLVVALRLALLVLVLGAEVTAAALATVERVAAHQHPELEEVVDAAGLLQRLVDRAPVAGDAEILLELVVERGQLGQRLLQALLGALHPAVVPDDLAELAVE